VLGNGPGDVLCLKQLHVMVAELEIIISLKNDARARTGLANHALL
jgi:hypothetical protein